jgi:NitT/TauT family transport system substrate-binding protein
MCQRTRRNRRWWAVLITAAAFAFLAGSVGKASAQTVGQTPTAQVKLQAGYFPIASYTFVQVAREKGLWAAEGIEIEGVFATGGQDLVSALESGKMQVASLTPNTAIAAFSKGFRIKIIGANEATRGNPPDGGALLVTNDAGINGVADLKGKRIATITIQSILWLVTRDVIKKAGVDPAAVNFVEVPIPQMGDAMLHKNVDAAMTVEPFTSKLLATGKFKVLAYPYVESIPNAPLAVWVAHEDWLKSNPDVAARFVRVMKNATKILNNANEADARGFVARFTKVESGSIQNMILPRWTNELDVAGLQRVADKMTENGVLSGKADVANMIWVPK